MCVHILTTRGGWKLVIGGTCKQCYMKIESLSVDTVRWALPCQLQCCVMCAKSSGKSPKQPLHKLRITGNDLELTW